MQSNRRTHRLSSSTAGSLYIVGVLLMVGIALAIKAVRQQELDSFPIATAQPVTVEISNSWVESPLEERIARAELIVRAEILNPLPSRWNTADGQLPPDIRSVSDIPWDTVIFTDTPIKVMEYLNGRATGEELLVRTLGGTVGRDIMTAEGPDLRLGQEVILFLTGEAYEAWNVGPDHYWIVQGPLGVFEISGQDVLTAPTREHPGRMPLQELLSMIAAANGQGN